MVSQKSVTAQLKKINFSAKGWNRAEVRELHKVLIPEEEIYECVNGLYEGGFALLVATNVRVVLIDKKPLNFLTVEDLRFDMINEIDYSHRLMGAQINISTGSRQLKFRSYNQQRLRKLITHIQHCMAQTKVKQNEHAEDQKQHLQEINNQLQAYLFAQHQQQQQLHQQLQKVQADPAPQLQPVRPSPQLSDYLYAQSLLAQHQAKDDLYEEGVREVFGNRQAAATPTPTPAPTPPPAPVATAHNPLEINALRIAYSKLPMALRNRKFGRPSFHAHSQAPKPLPASATSIR